MDSPFRILLVDDDRELHRIYEETFRLHFENIVVLSHCFGPSQLAAAITSEDPHIIILDQMFPSGERGTELISSIHGLNSSILVILNSAFGNEQLASDALDAHADEYVVGSKLDINVLLERVEEAMEKVGGNSVLDEMGTVLTLKVNGIRPTNLPSP
jgi:DNA-binding response OmpR family regulator